MEKQEVKPNEEEPIINQVPIDQAEHTSADEASAEPSKTPIEETEEKYEKLNDKYLRLYSEYENYRKRTKAEMTDLLLNGSRDMIKSILPIIDDFERALAHEENEEGVKLIYNKLIKILEQKGLKAMDVLGQKFDENLHEAVTRIPATDPAQKGMVMDIVEKGYYLNDKVLRYAKVVVAY